MSDVNIFSLLTKSELQNLSLVDGAKDFLVKGPGTNADGIQVRNALPLLADFIKTSDNAVQNHESGAWLRFAHAETIAPLATFMELSGAAEADTSIFNYNQVWNVSNIMGYSRNIQWIFYKKTNSNRDDDIRLKILLNEIPVHIPVATTEFPYYNWSEVRRFYITKIKDHGVNLTDNMYQYLLGLN
ncbi:MAG TPA: hypothetical protein VG847_02830 [Chitinophagaceae bacterium]|nr:hypothetical protein [Chitinophagaceae bacterium]